MVENFDAKTARPLPPQAGHREVTFFSGFFSTKNAKITRKNFLHRVSKKWKKVFWKWQKSTLFGPLNSTKHLIYGHFCKNFRNFRKFFPGGSKIIKNGLGRKNSAFWTRVGWYMPRCATKAEFWENHDLWYFGPI